MVLSFEVPTEGDSKYYANFGKLIEVVKNNKSPHAVARRAWPSVDSLHSVCRPITPSE